MKKLRLVFNNMNNERKDITLPMKKWIVDWWFNCDIVPSNDTIIIVAELDGKSILNNTKTFEEIAYYFNWGEFFDNFIKDIKAGLPIENNSIDFNMWLQNNLKLR